MAPPPEAKPPAESATAPSEARRNAWATLSPLPTAADGRLRSIAWRSSCIVLSFCLASCAIERSDEAASKLKVFSAPPVSPPASAALRRPAQEVASYRMSVRLDELRMSLSGTALITLHNSATRELDELYFHLYLNAFENSETLFLRKGGSRNGTVPGRWGRIDVHSLRRRGEQRNLWEDAARHSPDDQRDRTSIRVPLKRPVAPGETARFELEFTSTLPEIVERTGFRDEFVLAGQWYPKLAKLERDGSWAHFPFHPYGEFYADFGDYDVTLDLPSRFVVGATGDLLHLGTANGRSRYRSTVKKVHDFAWTAWPHFEVETRQIDQVVVRLLAPAHTEEVRKRTWQTVEDGLSFLGTAYGEYPHPTLTIVHPPHDAARAGGMEYPTFITTGGPELAARAGARIVELVTIHELAHQWFQGMVATNEQAAPFLDEGLTSYAEWRFLEFSHGPGSLLDLPGFRISRAAAGRALYFSAEAHAPIAQAAADFSSFRQLATEVYNGTPLVMATLAGTLGRKKFEAALGAYARRYRFGHPGPEDFYETLETFLPGAKVRPLFEEHVTFDLSVESAELRVEETKARLSAVVQSEGPLPLPYTLRVEWHDGRIDTRSLSDEGASQVDLLRDCPSAEACATAVIDVDPERSNWLDSDFGNNRFVAKRQGTAPITTTHAPSTVLQLTWWLSWLLG